MLRRSLRFRRPRRRFVFDRERTSDLFERLAREKDADGKMTMDEILLALGNRGVSVVLIVFAAASAVPFVAWIACVPLLAVAFRLMLGMEQMKIPAWMGVGGREMERRTLSRIFLQAARWLRPLERICKPRLAAMNGPAAQRVMAVMITLLAIIIVLPLPGLNAPAGLTIVIIALAFLEHDGVMALLGFLAGFTQLVMLYVFSELALKAFNEALAYLAETWSLLSGLF